MAQDSEASPLARELTAAGFLAISGRPLRPGQVVIPDPLQKRIRFLARMDFLEKRHQALRLDAVLAADAPDVSRAHAEMDAALELLRLVDPDEAERLINHQPEAA